MFAPANVVHFELKIPKVRNDFKVLAFDGTEAISRLYAINIELIRRLCAEDGIAWHHQHSPDGHRVGETPYQPGSGICQVLKQQSGAANA
ncbi:hypothetical protein PS903_06107 [Pseudomonas fluorescens]|nr:hypothetical protein PS903_06107 [Pseudomonas fluorescens]